MPVLKGIKKSAPLLAEYARDERAAISPMMVFMLIPLCGIMALAGEVSFWFMTQRALQNAADSAALAAATNNSDTTDNDSGGMPHPRYQTEAFSMARGYGLQNNVNNITITPINNQTCPDGDTNCYRVTIARRTPLYLSRMVGYSGDDGEPAFTKLVAAEALAKPPSSSAPLCIGALSQSGGLSPPGTAVRITGGTTDLSDCSVVSRSELMCSSGIPVGEIFATGTTSCNGAEEETIIGSSDYQDPYASINWDSLIPTSPCTGTRLSDITNWTNPVVVCTQTNATLARDVTITEPGARIIMVGQTLRLGNFTLRTSGAGTATIVFTSTGGTVPVWMNGSTSGGRTGTIEIAAPPASSTAPLKNFALIGDPRRTTTTQSALGNYSQGSNRFNMNILGVVYAPHTDVIASGNIITNLNGYHCISLLARTFDANGGKFITSPNDGCTGAGINVPTVPSARARLVQ